VRADADRFPDLDVLMTAMEREWRTLANALRATAPRDAVANALVPA
jgi:hypothetical protein